MAKLDRTTMPLPTPNPPASSMFSGLSEYVQKVSSEPGYSPRGVYSGLFNGIVSGYMDHSNKF